jgi:hypothetical protein
MPSLIKYRGEYHGVVYPQNSTFTVVIFDKYVYQKLEGFPSEEAARLEGVKEYERQKIQLANKKLEIDDLAGVFSAIDIDRQENPLAARIAKDFPFIPEVSGVERQLLKFLAVMYFRMKDRAKFQPKQRGHLQFKAKMFGLAIKIVHAHSLGEKISWSHFRSPKA